MKPTMPSSKPMSSTEPSEFATLDDPQFLSARARLRQRLEDLPERHVDRARFQLTYDAMTREFDRRASRSWTQSASPPGEIGKAQPMDDNARLLAIEVLLADPEAINDILETELYLLREKLQPQPSA